MQSRHPLLVPLGDKFNRRFKQQPKPNLKELNLNSDSQPKGGAKAKLRAHFLNNIGRVMDSEELRVVASNQSE